MPAKIINNSDALSAMSRAFFERAKMKLAVSFLLCVFAWIMIAWAAQTGGAAAADKQLFDQAATIAARAPYYAAGGGAGFASFCFVLGFIMLTAGGIYISPLCTGSINERKTLCAPIEIRALSEEPLE